MALEQRHPLLDHADYLKLPDEPRGEVIGGVFFVTPSPKALHRKITTRLVIQLGKWLDEHPGIGDVYAAPFDVVPSKDRPATIVQPDVLFVSAERAGIVQDWVFGAPDIAIEVLSPSSMSRDAVRKRELYARFGVREFWLVSPEEQQIDVFTGAYDTPHTFTLGDTLTSELLPGFTLDLKKLYS
jgi:Uma2 family endonuclease